MDEYTMKDARIIKRIVDLLEVKPSDVILEIGGGTGALTKEIVKRKPKKIIVVEIDNRFEKELEKTGAEVIIHDILEMNLPEADKIVSNVPYSICEPLMWKLIHLPCRTVLTLPEKFVERITAEKGKSYSKLTLMMQSFFNIAKDMKVPPEAFKPQPDVISRIVVLTPKKGNFIIQKLFLQQDKKVRNALRDALCDYGLTKKEALKKIENLDIPDIKVSELPLKAFARLKAYKFNCRI